MAPLNDLKAVLCDPDGKCCIKGSDADRLIIDKALAALEAAQANQVINVDGVFPEWKPGSADFKYWCNQHFGPDADEVYLAEAVLLLPRKTTEPMKAADEFELRRLLAEERFTVSRLSRALQESTEGPTLMGEPVLEVAQAGEPVAYIRRDQLQKAQQAAFLCEVSPESRSDRVAIFTHLAAPQVPMTNHKARELWQTIDTGDTDDDVIAFARAIEAHHNIGVKP